MKQAILSYFMAWRSSIICPGSSRDVDNEQAKQDEQGRWQDAEEVPSTLSLQSYPPK